MIWAFFALLKNPGAANAADLKIGDTLPPVMVTYLTGGNVVAAPLQSFYRDKCIILDFWTTTCPPCIRSLIKIDSIDNNFEKDLEVLPVTYEDAPTVKSFIESRKVVRDLKFSYIVNATTLIKLFKFRIVPHEVWIDRQGIIRAITYPDQITSANLSRFINNETLALEVKNDPTEFSFFERLKVDNNAFTYRSILAPHIAGVSLGWGAATTAMRTNEKLDRFIGVNCSILGLYYAVYSQSHSAFLFNNRVELNVKDTFAVDIWHNRQEVERSFVAEHSYCYELVTPQKLSPHQFYGYLMDELNKMFPVTGSIVKRKRECWILVNRYPGKNPAISNLTPKLTWTNGLLTGFENQKIDVMVSYLNWNMDSLPVVDETKFNKGIDIVVDVAGKTKGIGLNVERIKKSLQVYGFDLIRGKRWVGVLVLQDKGNDL